MFTRLPACSGVFISPNKFEKIIEFFGNLFYCLTVILLAAT
jgi:hypothetical protein